MSIITFKIQRWTISAAIGVMLVIAALALAGNGLFGATLASADDETLYFAFVAVAGADATDGIVPRLGTNGAGVFNPKTGEAAGGGTFEMFDLAPPGVPKPQLRSAKWEIKRLIEWTPCSSPDNCTTPGGTTYGNIIAGVADFEVDIKYAEGRKLKGVVLRVICNIGFAGIINIDSTTGNTLPEGYFITIPDPVLGTLEFKPLSPNIGITHIGVDPDLNFALDDNDDDDDDDDD